MLRTATRHSAIGTDAAKVAQAREIARRWSEARRMYARDYAGAASLGLVMGSSKTASNARARTGWAAVDLNYHYHKIACESALSILRGGWETTFAKVRTLIGRNKRFTPAERHELFYLLKAPPLLTAILTGEVPEQLTEKSEFAHNDHGRLCAYLARMIRRYQTPAPRLGKSDGFELDNTLYRVLAAPKPSKRRSARARVQHFTGPWMAISGLTKGQTIRIPLAGRDLAFLDDATRRNLRVKVLVDRIELQIPVKVEIPEPVEEATRPESVVGVDKGYRVLLAASADGDPAHARLYGEDFGDLCDTIDDAQQRRTKNRNRLRSHGRARGRRDIGGQKHTRRLAAENATIKNAVGRGVNAFIADHPDMTVLVEERLFGGGKSKGRKWNRRLSGWVRGTLAQSLANKTSAHGVRREEVNPAYTSQACHACGHIDPMNRQGQVFRCRACGYDAHADGLAASNVRARHGDQEITLWTPKARVKQILDARCQAVVRSATCGSNSSLNQVIVAGRAVNTMNISAEPLTHLTQMSRGFSKTAVLMDTCPSGLLGSSFTEVCQQVSLWV